MTPQELGLFLMSVVTSVAGQFFLKVGALKLGKVTAENIFAHLVSMLTIPELLAGLTCYGLGAFAYILLLTRVDLSIAGPAIALVYVFSVALGYFVFREPLPLIRIVALILILAGVCLLVWKK